MRSGREARAAPLRFAASWPRSLPASRAAGKGLDSCVLIRTRPDPVTLEKDPPSAGAGSPAGCADFFVLQQIPDPAVHLAGTAGGGVLDLVPAIFIPLPPLGGVPELEAQALCAVLQSPADHLSGRGLDLLLLALGAGMLLLYFLDGLSPPV